MARLKEQYQSEMVDALIKKFGYKNIMEVPKLDKIVINMGVGEAKDNAKVLDSAVRDSLCNHGIKCLSRALQYPFQHHLFQHAHRKNHARTYAKYMDC